MAYLGRKGAVAGLTSSDIPDNSITAAKIVDGAIDFQDEIGFLENKATTQNLSGTYSTERMYLNDSYTLTGDVTITGHLALGTVADSDVVITDDGSTRIITGEGTLESGELLSSKETDLTGMTGQLGSAVTGNPNLNLGNATFPSGTPTKIAIVTLGSDVSRYSSGSFGDLTTLTYTPSRACTIRAVLRLSCKIHGYATNDCRASLRCFITGTGSTTVTWDTDSNSPAGQGYGQYFYNAPANFGIHTHTVFDVSLPDFVANNTNQITFDFDVATVATGSSNGWEWMGNGTTSETFLKIFECTT